MVHINNIAHDHVGRAIPVALFHWKEYLMEAAGLGIFMISACFFGSLLEYHKSPVHLLISDSFFRQLLMGAAMGLTAIGIIYSGWGKRSGAHINPAVTLTFYRLGKISTADMLFYCLFQVVGGLIAVLFMVVVIGRPLEESPVNYVATVPGKMGTMAAMIVELLIAFIHMTIVLKVSDSSFSKYTGVVAGILVFSWVVIAGPVSGFGMNPARSLASAIPSNIWTAFWIYLIMPVLGMLAAAEVHLILKRK